MPNLLPATLIFIIWTSATIAAALPFVLLGDYGKAYQLCSIAAAPLIFVVVFSIVGGLLSRFGKKGIVAGKFPRENLHPVYLMRRIYGACWTQLYYFKPVYSVVLAIPVFKKLILRLYGYRGACDFNVYPDTWIRDLPLLNIGSGAYLSNRATLGSNICLSDGNIFVDGIHIEKKGLVGHLAAIGAGARIGEGAEIGINCAIGIRVTIKAGASIKPRCSINHGTVIGQNAEIGTSSYVGLRCEIADGLSIPAGANLPAGAILKTQEDVNQYYSSESEKLKSHAELISEILAKQHLNAV